VGCGVSKKWWFNSLMADRSLDTTGLKCPLPIMKAAKAIVQICPGGTLEVFATDPGAVADFEAFCETKGHELLACEKSEGTFRFLIKKKNSS
jgi:tRNA 2-thiouridine synthesizing protein A